MCFTGIASQLGGLGFEQIALRTLSVHDRGFSPDGGYTVARRDVFEDCGEGIGGRKWRLQKFGLYRNQGRNGSIQFMDIYGVYSYIPQIFCAKRSWDFSN